MGVLRWLLALALLVLDFFGMIGLFLVFRPAIWASPLLAIPLVLAFVVLSLVVPVLVVAYLILGPVERSRAHRAMEETRGGGYASNYPGVPMRFADYRPGSRSGSERKLRPA